MQSAPEVLTVSSNMLPPHTLATTNYVVANTTSRSTCKLPYMAQDCFVLYFELVRKEKNDEKYIVLLEQDTQYNTVTQKVIKRRGKLKVQNQLHNSEWNVRFEDLRKFGLSFRSQYTHTHSHAHKHTILRFKHYPVTEWRTCASPHSPELGGREKRFSSKREEHTNTQT